MMKKYMFLIICFVTVMTSSCISDYVLEDTVFIEDDAYPGLPIYSEWGYNTFGVYFDRQVFVSNRNNLSGKIIVKTDTFRLQLNGEMNGNETKLIFAIKGYNPVDYEDLISLNDSIFNLKSGDCKVIAVINGKNHDLKIIEGTLNFKHVQKLYIDHEMTKSIISGYFSFKALMDDEPIAATNGRFDLGIGYDNFYNY